MGDGPRPRGEAASASLLADARATLAAWAAPTAEQDALRAEFAELLAEPEALFRARHPDHLTASALVINRCRTHVLLTHHRRAGAWFQFGGHLEPGDATLAGAALREATEESGVAGLWLEPGPVQLDVHEVGFCHAGGGVRHFDVRYLLVAPEDAQVTVSPESFDVAWWPVNGLPTREASLLDLVRIGCG